MDGVDPVVARIAAQSLSNDARAVADYSAEANAAANGVGYGHVMTAANASIESLMSTLDALTELLEAKATAIELAASGVDYGLVGSVQWLANAGQLALDAQVIESYVNPAVMDVGGPAPQTSGAAIKALDVAKQDPATMARLFSSLSVEHQILVAQQRPDLVGALISELETVHPTFKQGLITALNYTVDKSTISIDGSGEAKLTGKYIDADGKIYAELTEKLDGSSVLKVALAGGVGVGLSAPMKGLDLKGGVAVDAESYKEITFPSGVDAIATLEELGASVAEGFDIREFTNPLGPAVGLVDALEATALAAGGKSTKVFSAEVGFEGDIGFKNLDREFEIGASAIKVSLEGNGELKYKASNDGSYEITGKVGGELEGQVVPLSESSAVKGGIVYSKEITYGREPSGQHYLQLTTVTDMDVPLGKVGSISPGTDGKITETVRANVDGLDVTDLLLHGMPENSETKVVETRNSDITTSLADGDLEILGNGIEFDVSSSIKSSETVSIVVTPVIGDPYSPTAIIATAENAPAAPPGGECGLTPAQ